MLAEIQNKTDMPFRCTVKSDDECCLHKRVRQKQRVRLASRTHRHVAAFATSVEQESVAEPPPPKADHVVNLR